MIPTWLKRLDKINFTLQFVFTGIDAHDVAHWGICWNGIHHYAAPDYLFVSSFIVLDNQWSMFCFAILFFYLLVSVHKYDLIIDVNLFEWLT